MKEFVPLHVHSGYSYLDSGIQVENLPHYAKKMGYSSIALTDKGNMSGLAPFYHLSEKEGIAPIFGMDVQIDEGSFTLIVKSEAGYRNLLSIALKCSRNELALHDLIEKQGGLAVIYEAKSSPYLSSVPQDEKSMAQNLNAVLSKFVDLFIGIPYRPEESDYVLWLRSFAASHSYNPIAFPLFAYFKKEDAITLRIVNAIANKEKLTVKEESGFDYFAKKEEMLSFFSDEEISATASLAESISFKYISKRGSLLHFPNEMGLTSEEYLRKTATEGLIKKKGPIADDYKARLEYELGIITAMGYADYFLLVSDYVRWAKTHGVSVGPGRGSGAGSLVAYALDIVVTDPIEEDLLFERFLNPERQSMPDIDIDFSDLNREKVVFYLQEKYGSERVGRVMTSQTIGAKEALRDIARVYGYADREVELIISTLADDRRSLRENYKLSAKFKRLVDSDKYYLQFVALASKIEGLPRQSGLHAAGVVLNDEPLSACLPVSDQPTVGYVACLEKDYLEEQGFLKFDLLGLRNLSIIDNCLSLIEKDQGIRLSHDDIPWNDAESIRIISENKTMGIFQLESPGMNRAISEVKPTTFDDVAALLALYRPGPMQSIPSFAKRKRGEERITYPSPELEPILKGTYGIIVYQEQIMQILRAMAGFSYGQADLFRRAISKKDSAKLASLKQTFIDGCLKNGKDLKLAESVYALIYRFADYGFNKSHAVSYAVLTCRMAYLKKHYPKEFYASILNSLSVNDRKFGATLSEMKRTGLALSSPSINQSSQRYEVVGGKILMPLTSLKGIMSNVVLGIVDERNMNGPFADFFDFVGRSRHCGLNLQTLIKLIDSGALDCFAHSRRALREASEGALRYANMVYGEDGKKSLLTISIAKPLLSDASGDLEEDIQAEKEALGMLVSLSPLARFKDAIDSKGLKNLSDLASNPEGEVAAIVKGVKVITTKKGAKMCFLSVYDNILEVEFTLFAEAYSEALPYLVPGTAISLSYRKDPRSMDRYIAARIGKLGE